MFRYAAIVFFIMVPVMAGHWQHKPSRPIYKSAEMSGPVSEPSPDPEPGDGPGNCMAPCTWNSKTGQYDCPCP